MPQTKNSPSGLAAGHERSTPLSRRRFLGYAGAATGIITVATGCNRNDFPSNSTNDEGLDMRSGNAGIITLFYVLENLSAMFFTEVVNSPFAGITPAETALIKDIRDHEIAHREVIRDFMNIDDKYDLEYDFSSIDFGSRSSVLAAAGMFKDLMVSAYTGGASLIDRDLGSQFDYGPIILDFAAKVASVEARHAAYVREISTRGSFADDTVIDANGFDLARTPSEVIAIAQPYIKTKLNASNLPTF